MKVIYSEHYYDKLAGIGSIRNAFFYREKTVSATEQEFVQEVVAFSKSKRISVDVYEEGRAVIADFIIGNEMFSPQSTVLFASLVKMASLVEVVANDERRNALVIRLAYKKGFPLGGSCQRS